MIRRILQYLASFFRPWHSTEDVLRELLEGLRDGSIVLHDEEEPK